MPMRKFSCFTIFLAILAATFPSISVGFQYGRCFQRIERHSIDNSQPLTEIFRTSPLDCLEQCILHTGNGDEQADVCLSSLMEQSNLSLFFSSGHCRSVVYDYLQHSCRLYGHDGRKVPAIVHPANGFDLFIRTASSQECAGPVQRILALHAKKGVFGAANHPAQSTGGKGPIYPPVLGQGGDAESAAALGDQELTALLDKLERGKGAGGNPQLDSPKAVEGEEETGQTGLVGTVLDCAAQGRPTGFLEFPGGEKADAEDASEEFLGWSQKQCADFCAENEGPDGESNDCAGYSFVPGGGRCRMHRKLAEGELTLRSFGGGVYAEKWCIPAHRYGVCRESSQFRIHLQQRYNMRCVPLSVQENVQTLVDCMQKCLDQFGCQSISFHAPSLRCLLHRERPSPTLVESADQGWTLAENGCTQRNGPIGLVDSEDGELGTNGNINSKNEENGGQITTSSLDDPALRDGAVAFGVANRDCGPGRLIKLLFGQKKRRK